MDFQWTSTRVHWSSLESMEQRKVLQNLKLAAHPCWHISRYAQIGLECLRPSAPTRNIDRWRQHSRIAQQCARTSTARKQATRQSRMASGGWNRFVWDQRYVLSPPHLSIHNWAGLPISRLTIKHLQNIRMPTGTCPHNYPALSALCPFPRISK